MKKIGIFSGTFDPFHRAHLEACLVAKEACSLDSTVVVLEHDPHRKQMVTAYHHRLEMIDLAIQDYPSIRLLEAPADNITFENLWPILTKQFGDAEYWYILGSDLLTHLDQWPAIGAMLKHIKLCVFLRDNADKAEVTALLHKLQSKFGDLEYTLLPQVWSGVSSSRIRDEIHLTGLSDNVDPAVMAYITKNSIY